MQTSQHCVTRKQLSTSVFKVKLTHSTLCVLKLPSKCSCRFGCTLDRLNKDFFFFNYFFSSKDDWLWSPHLLFLSFSDGEGKKRTSTVCSSESLNAVGATLTPRRISWRRRIFLQVASPMNKSPSKMQHPGLCVLLKKINKQLLLNSYYCSELQRENMKGRRESAWYNILARTSLENSCAQLPLGLCCFE